ncbi:predicted protein [Sclerotinia sclerotiorum 1980 UF-70]|uniref:Uncharacterized protein n=1 Tax=Sclerotinia sclerotiorum (strain ATCC 18683 / 1980 / Ss-1) TaxID=665079 RepID=A7EC61_SCLS1|nr:predicted protein [Sclerotinia sclerotiorum 1980 UF-70]EDO00040.1 predicted protein [Sclerotinia sclerotiorum 1980 UF-70]
MMRSIPSKLSLGRAVVVRGLRDMGIRFGLGKGEDGLEPLLRLRMHSTSRIIWGDYATIT